MPLDPSPPETSSGIKGEPSLDWSIIQDQVELRGQESPHYYYLLQKAIQTDVAQLREEAEEFRRLRWEQVGQPTGRPLDRFATFIDMALHPEAYRARPVTLRGHTQDILATSASRNEYGIERQYEAWLYTPDSQRIPTIVVFTELPEGLEPGKQLVDGVRVTGYFLKHQAYTAHDGQRHFAPLILAHRLEWTPKTVSMELPNWLIAAGAFLVVLIAICVWWSNRRDREFTNRRLASEAGEVDLSQLRVEE